MRYLSVSLLPGHNLCATMELGSLEGSYLELLNSDADPLHLYHLYDQMDLAGEEEIELSSGGPVPQPLLAFLVLLLAPYCKLKKGSGCLSEPWTAPSPCQWRGASTGDCPLLPQHPSSQTGFVLGTFSPTAEPDTDTINCDQFSKLLQDMEGDEETREAYANIGKEAAGARERTH